MLIKKNECNETTFCKILDYLTIFYKKDFGVPKFFLNLPNILNAKYIKDPSKFWVLKKPSQNFLVSMKKVWSYNLDPIIFFGSTNVFGPKKT